MSNVLSKESSLFNTNKAGDFVISDEYGDSLVSYDGETTIKIERTRIYKARNQRTKDWFKMINGGRRLLSGTATVNMVWSWHMCINKISFHTETMIFSLNGQIKALSKVLLATNTIRLTTDTLAKWEFLLQQKLFKHNKNYALAASCWIIGGNGIIRDDHNISNYCWYPKCSRTTPLFTKEQLQRRKQQKKQRKRKNKTKARKEKQKKKSEFAVVCEGCRTSSYCCRKHQKLDWNEHKKYCINGRLSRVYRLYCMCNIGLHCFH